MLVGNGWAFVHIPKCGGTSVRHVMHGREVFEVLPLAEERTVSHHFHGVAKTRPAGRVFCFVRHPAAWLRSYWDMRVLEGRRDPRKVLDRLWSDDFDLWVERVCQERPGYVGRLFDAYIAHTTEVHRLEDGLDPVLSDILGRPIHTRRHNRGRQAPISRATAERIQESERNVINRFYPCES